MNLFESLTAADAGSTNASQRHIPITDNGIHLNAWGYRLAANAMSTSLGWKRRMWRYSILSDGKIRRGRRSGSLEAPPA